MNDFLRWFLVALLYTIPTFFIVLFVTCTDVVSYKKLRTTNQTVKLLFLNLLIVGAAHILASGIITLFSYLPDPLYLYFSPLVLVPLFTVLPLIILPHIERKNTCHPLGRPTPSKKIVVSNIIMTLLFEVSYVCFDYWHAVKSWEETMVIIGTVDPKLAEKWSNIFNVGVIALIILFVLIKIVSQVIILRRESKELINE